MVVVKDLELVKMKSEKFETNECEAVGSVKGLKRVHKTADTSVEAFLDLIKSGSLKKQNDIMLECLARYQPLTRRQAARITGLELNSAGRCLNYLENTGLVKVALKDQSPDTNKRVAFYSLKDWEPHCEQLEAA